MRFIVPTILLLLAIASFVMFTDPAYQAVKNLKVVAAQYNTALTNSRELQQQRDSLNAKYRAISPDALVRLSKLLPDNADNIRLVIDIQQMAQSYGMSLSAIKFDAGQTAAATSAAGNQLAAGTPANVAQASKDYGVFDLEFSTTSSYDNFLSFLKDIESSLRLTDIQSVTFSSGDVAKIGLTTYTVKLRTYWLKT